MKNKLWIIIPLLVFLIIPQITDAWAFDLAQTQLQGLAEKTGPIAAIVIVVFIIFALGYAALFITTSLLQGIIEATPLLLTVTGGGMGNTVRAMWGFTSGITNMLLLIAFVVIALAIILGVESYGLKKALPKFVIVALLINFTLLFVGMGIDISNFLFNSIFHLFEVDDGNVLLGAILPLFEIGSELFDLFILVLAGWGASLAVPYLNVAVQIGWLVSFPFIFGMLIEYLVYGIIMLLMSGVFFIFFFIFLIRIFIIQILAIVAPFAFFCLIFNSTTKWFNTWLNHLVQWLLVGVAFIFFIYIGITFAPYAQIMGETMGNALGQLNVPWWMAFFLRNTEQIVTYLTLLIYFIIILGILYKFIPAAAQAVVGQVGGFLKAAAPYAKAIGKGGLKKYQELPGEVKEQRRQIKEKGMWEGTKAYAKESFKRGVLTPIKTRSEMVKREAGKTPIDREVEKTLATYKGKSGEEKAIGIKAATSNEARVALINQADKEKEFKSLQETVGYGNLSKMVNENLVKAAEKMKMDKSIKKNLPQEYLKIMGPEKFFENLVPSDMDDNLSKKIAQGSKEAREGKKEREEFQTVIKNMITLGHTELARKFLSKGGYNAVVATRNELKNITDKEKIEFAEGLVPRERTMLGLEKNNPKGEEQRKWKR